MTRLIPVDQGGGSPIRYHPGRTAWVIQEALHAGRPVVCSDIGGMAEKVTDGKSGLLFPAGSAIELASLLQPLADNRDRLTAVQESLPEWPLADPAIARHIELHLATKTNQEDK